MPFFTAHLITNYSAIKITIAVPPLMPNSFHIIQPSEFQFIERIRVYHTLGKIAKGMVPSLRPALAGEDTPAGRAFLVDIPTGPGTAG